MIPDFYLLSLEEINDYYVVNVFGTNDFFIGCKKYQEWGCGIRDNWLTFQRLMRKIGTKEPIETIRFLNSFVSCETGKKIDYT